MHGFLIDGTNINLMLVPGYISSLGPLQFRRPARAIAGCAISSPTRSRVARSSNARRMDQQISLTDPDSRSMATGGRGSGVVGYNVQVAVDTEHHL